MKILITGGAGYIGSITNRELTKAGFETVIFDNLSEGHKEAVGQTRVIVGDLTDKSSITKVFKEERFDAVVHFAAKALASESMEKPYAYFSKNIIGGLNLLEAMRAGNCHSIVFSSTCAVYGYPKKFPVTEDDELKPVSVYGETKRIFESMLFWYDQIYAIRSITLRYFNAAGATEDGKLGEEHRLETHIIPLAIKAAMNGKEPFLLYGDDYNTPDGTCLRDYIHVIDLAEAHILALKKLMERAESAVYNLGTEKPDSNKEVIAMVKKVTGVDFPVNVANRREGDPAAIYADSSKAKKELGWQPKFDNLETIIQTAWQWHKNHQKESES